MPTLRSTCPRHCYGTCSIISHYNGEKLTKVSGDDAHGYTTGRLCAKGYSLIQYAHDKNRLKFPMLQINRGSGIWRRITWEEAYNKIAEKIIGLHSCYGSNLASGYVKGHGNDGLLHQAVEGMFSSIGPHTRSQGDICSSVGIQALRETMGEMPCRDPEEMAQAMLIVIWGANPAVTNVNQMKFIYEARKKDAPFAVIDPLFTSTAKKADYYLQIKPGTDALLAWSLAKLLIEHDQIDRKFIDDTSIGWDLFRNGLKQLDLDLASQICGIPIRALEELADCYHRCYPSVNWIGFGIHRTRHSFQSTQAISALSALTGNLCPEGGGLYFQNHHLNDFPQLLRNHKGPEYPKNLSSRDVDTADFARQALALNEPPLRFLWITCGNPLAQDHNFSAWYELLNQLEMIVVVDLYLTKSAQQADLVLPAASFFEEEDLHLSYWHHWLSINQKVSSGFFEAKSDLQIARELTTALNARSPGFSNFPSALEPLEWMEKEITPNIQKLYAITEASDLIEHPYKRTNGIFPSPSWRFNFPKIDLEIYEQSLTIPDSEHPLYYLFTPQSLLKFHTQYETLPWLNQDQEPVLEISAKTAKEHHIKNEALIEVFNQHGSVRGRARINSCLQEQIILAKQSGEQPLNGLIESGHHFYDCLVSLRKVHNV